MLFPLSTQYYFNLMTADDCDFMTSGAAALQELQRTESRIIDGEKC